MRPLVTTLALLASLSCGVATAQEAPSETSEPPHLYYLEVAGVELEIRLDEPFDIEANGKVPVTLRTRPHRVLETACAAFRFPASYSFEHEANPGLNTWILSGNDAVVMLFRYDYEADAATVLQQTVDSLKEAYGANVERTRRQTIQLGGRELAGVRVEARIAGSRIIQTVFAFEQGGRAHTLILQDSPEDGEQTTADGDRSSALLQESFEFRED